MRQFGCIELTLTDALLMRDAIRPLARVEPFDPGARIGNFGAVLVALAGPWPIGRATIDALTRSPTIVVDLSVPAAVPARLAEFLGPRLITADALDLPDAATKRQHA